MANAQETKISKLRKLWNDGDWHGALRIAAGFPRLGPHKESIQRGWAALNHAQMYREMEQSPEDLVRWGVLTMVRLYELDLDKIDITAVKPL